MITEEQLNLATENSFIAIIPIEKINNTLSASDIVLNLTTYETPEISISTTETSFMGYSVPLPTGIKDQEKNYTFEYMIDSNWKNYLLLYNWITKYSKEIGTGMNTNVLSEYMLPVSVYMINEYKKPVICFKYNNCIINKMGNVSMTYQTSRNEELKHNFSIIYQNYEVIPLNNQLR